MPLGPLPHLPPPRRNSGHGHDGGINRRHGIIPARGMPAERKYSMQLSTDKFPANNNNFHMNNMPRHAQPAPAGGPGVELQVYYWGDINFQNSPQKGRLELKGIKGGTKVHSCGGIHKTSGYRWGVKVGEYVCFVLTSREGSGSPFFLELPIVEEN